MVMATELVKGLGSLTTAETQISSSSASSVPSQRSDPDQQSQSSSAQQQVQLIVNWPTEDDGTPSAAPLSVRMPFPVPAATKKKHSFWAPRLQTDEALRNGFKDIKDAPFPLAAEYFEAAMRVGDKLHTGMSDKEFIAYVGYVRWILQLRANHTWDSVMFYDEAFRIEMELHPEWSWSVRPAHLERIHLLNKPSSADYAGSKRRASSQGGETCRNFNKNKCKNGDTCQYVHRCSTCSRQGHPASKCETPKGQSRQDSSQGAPGGNRA